MPRLIGEDLMQSYQYWLIDVTPQLFPPFLVLGGVSMGFSAITAPEVTLETQEIPEMNSMWKRHHYTGANVSPITLSRGARADDDSLWDWCERAIRGSDVVYRDLMLVHSTRAAGSGGDVVGLAAGLVNPLGIIGALAAPEQQEARRVAGRLWILWHCIPTGCKFGDFDATNGDIAIDEITIQPRAINHFALGKQSPF